MSVGVDRAIFFAIGFFAGLVFSFFANLVSTAHAHDWKRPDLNAWYEGLRATGRGVLGRGVSCCSKQDCHTTEAEIRNGQWWARFGTPRNGQDWDLGEWTRVPDEVIVRGPNGNPVPNEAGEAVICHSLGVTAAASTIFCFVPPDQI